MAAQAKMKIVLLGEGRVGKTSILARLVRNTYQDDCPSTLEASMFAEYSIEVSTPPGADVTDSTTMARLFIWDTAGQERYHALGPIYYRDAQGAVLVYDITDYDSFTKVKVWFKELHEVLGDVQLPLVVIGNKSDLERDRQVPLEEAEKWTRQRGAQHFVVSAKLGRGVVAPFESLAQSVVRRLAERKQLGSKSSSVAAQPPRSRGLRVTLTPESEGYEGSTTAANADINSSCSC